ncbi:hypothetical protein Lser_V15G32390 [Lactuca serriola]
MSRLPTTKDAIRTVLNLYHSEVTGYDIRFESELNKWISYAISCNVEQLKLYFSMDLGAEFLLDQFIFISSCFTDLGLSGSKLNPVRVISWKNLRSLCTSNGNLDEDLIENILSGSPLLETLELEDCLGYSRVDITSKSVKNFVFSRYRDEFEDSASIIEIIAPYIVSLKIEGRMWLWKLLLV